MLNEKMIIPVINKTPKSIQKDIIVFKLRTPMTIKRIIIEEPIPNIIIKTPILPNKI